MIYDGDKYIGAGALVDNNVVVTAAHKVRDYTRQGYLVRISELDVSGKERKINLKSSCLPSN